MDCFANNLCIQNFLVHPCFTITLDWSDGTIPYSASYISNTTYSDISYTPSDNESLKSTDNTISYTISTSAGVHVLHHAGKIWVSMLLYSDGQSCYSNTPYILTLGGLTAIVILYQFEHVSALYMMWKLIII